GRRGGQPPAVQPAARVGAVDDGRRRRAVLAPVRLIAHAVSCCLLTTISIDKRLRPSLSGGNCCSGARAMAPRRAPGEPRVGRCSDLTAPGESGGLASEQALEPTSE